MPKKYALGKFSTSQTKYVLEKVLAGKLKKAEAARKLGVSRKTIYFWLRKYKTSRKDTQKTPKSRKRFTRDILRIITASPEFGPQKISKELKKRQKYLSPKSVWLVLKDLNLNSSEERVDYAYRYREPTQAKDPNFPVHLRLTPEARKRMVEEVILAKRKVGEVCREYQIPRKTFAKWKERYIQAQKAGENILLALSDQHPEGSKHPRGAGEQAISAVLNEVVENPEFSSHKIAQKLEFMSKARKDPSILIGNHGVQNILNRNNLNRYELRLAYSKAQQLVPKPIFVRVLDRIRSVLEQFIPSLAPAPPPEPSGAVRFLRTFAITSIFALTISYSLFIWLEYLSSQTPAAVLGLFFASVALFMGSLFFIYSLKYYITLAIVLSFSQQDPNPPAGGRGKREFVSWLLGLRDRESSGLTKEERKSIGLTPNLEHITLKRYPKVSVHIPLYNEKKVVERAIKAATNFDYPEYEVILCDDSNDETTEIIKRYQKSLGKLRTSRGDGYTLTECEIRPGVTLKHLHRTSRSGYKGGALRLALKCTDPRAEFVSVFDADFVPYPDTLELFLKYFQATAGSLEFKKRPSDQVIKKGNEDNSITSPIAAVQGYQWHVLNKSENWITRGVRSEYAGSYVIERSGEEIYGGLKQISGAVYMIRRDVLQEVGWETSITEDFQLTLKLYEKGYKVVYTPYIQAPAECVSTLQRLIKQRMRWAEGHSNNIKQMLTRLIFSKNLTTAEKLEVLYLSPYYLQAFFFLVGTISWLISETLFPARLPFWTSLWGWSLVLTNIISLPLMNAVGLFLEESEERDYAGILSFIALTYIIVPFQAYAAIKGFLESKEGPWFRTPKTGRITDVFTRGRFYRFISGILPGRSQPAAAQIRVNQYFAMATANNRFNSFGIKPRKRGRFLGKVFVSLLLAISLTLVPLANKVAVTTSYTHQPAFAFAAVGDERVEQKHSDEVSPEENQNLAVNTTKSVYELGEEVTIGMAVIDKVGRTVCDAKIELRITNYELRIDDIFSIADGTIEKSKECGPKTVTNTPDYSATYKPVHTGTYDIKVSTRVSGRTYVSESLFVVEEAPAFLVLREGPTRIYPEDAYTMTITFVPREDFSGEVHEVIPKDIKIKKVSEKGAVLRNIKNGLGFLAKEKEIVWQVDWKKGETYRLSYEFKTPLISPRLYKIGPLAIGDWKEARTWQVVIDTVSTVFDDSLITSTRYESSRKVFRNPAGNQNYYAFYMSSLACSGGGGRDCPEYGWSANGSTWNAGLEATGEGTLSPSDFAVDMFDDGTNAHFVLVHEKFNGKASYRHGTVAHSPAADAITWGTVNNIGSTEKTESWSTVVDSGGRIWYAAAQDTNDSFKLYINADSASDPASPPDAPSWVGANTVDDTDVNQKYVEVVDLGANTVGVVWQDDNLATLTAKKVTIASGSIDTSRSNDTEGSLTMTAGMFSATSDGSTAAHVLYKDGTNLIHQKIDFSLDTPVFGTKNTVFSAAVDTLALGQDQTSSPDELYAFYVKNSAKTDICWQTSPVDTISFSGEACPDDGGSDNLDFLSVSRKDWNSDSNIQVIYTRQTSAEVRFTETPEFLWLFFGFAPLLPYLATKKGRKKALAFARNRFKER